MRCRCRLLLLFVHPQRALSKVMLGDARLAQEMASDMLEKVPICAPPDDTADHLPFLIMQTISRDLIPSRDSRTMTPHTHTHTAFAPVPRALLQGIYVIGFSYPVVPLGAARIRTQISAAHTPDQVSVASQP